MLRSGITGGGMPTSFTPGIPMQAGEAGKTTGRFAKLQPASGATPLGGSGASAQNAEDMPKAVVKPWLAGRTSEQSKPAPGQLHPITQSVALAKVVGQIGRAGEGSGQFQEPVAICARGAKIAVADAIRRKFQIFNREGRVLGESRPNATIKGSKTNGGVFSKPSSIAIDSRGRVYASDASDHYIRVFDGQGTFQKEFLNKHGKDGGINGLYCDNAGNIYLADPDNGCVHVMAAETGVWMRKIGVKGTGEGQMQFPQGIAMDRFGQMFVVDYGTSRVSVFSKAGLFQRSWGSKGTGRGQFNVPRGIAIDRTDRVYIADSFNHRVCVFNTGGDYMYSFGGRGTEPGRFIGPSDLSIDPDNNMLYVVDKGNNRVQIFELLS
jgi:DNA-binding beta-propeller fold protein YncE